MKLSDQIIRLENELEHYKSSECMLELEDKIKHLEVENDRLEEAMKRMNRVKGYISDIEDCLYDINAEISCSSKP